MNDQLLNNNTQSTSCSAMSNHNVYSQPMPSNGVFNRQAPPQFNNGYQQSNPGFTLDGYAAAPGALMNLIHMSSTANILSELAYMNYGVIEKLYDSVEKRLRLDKLIKVKSHGGSHLYDTIVAGLIEVNAYRILSCLIPTYVRQGDQCFNDTYERFCEDLNRS